MILVPIDVTPWPDVGVRALQTSGGRSFAEVESVDISHFLIRGTLSKCEQKPTEGGQGMSKVGLGAIKNDRKSGMYNDEAEAEVN